MTAEITPKNVRKLERRIKECCYCVPKKSNQFTLNDLDIHREYDGILLDTSSCFETSRFLDYTYELDFRKLKQDSKFIESLNKTYENLLSLENMSDAGYIITIPQIFDEFVTTKETRKRVRTLTQHLSIFNSEVVDKVMTLFDIQNRINWNLKKNLVDTQNSSFEKLKNNFLHSEAYRPFNPFNRNKEISGNDIDLYVQTTLMNNTLGKYALLTQDSDFKIQGRIKKNKLSNKNIKLTKNELISGHYLCPDLITHPKFENLCATNTYIIAKIYPQMVEPIIVGTKAY